MPKKKTSKRKSGGVASKAVAHRQAYRRSEVARLRNSGYEVSEIAHKLGVTPKTVNMDLRELDEQWFWHARRDTESHMKEEIGQLLQVRENAWKAYHEYVNRHGEGHNIAALATVLKATQQLHDLLRLTDPNSNTGIVDADEAATVVEVTVRTREQAELLEQRSIEFDEQETLEGGPE